MIRADVHLRSFEILFPNSDWWGTWSPGTRYSPDLEHADPLARRSALGNASTGGGQIHDPCQECRRDICAKTVCSRVVAE